MLVALRDVLGVLVEAWQRDGDWLMRVEYQQVEMILDCGFAGQGTARLAIADLDKSGSASAVRRSLAERNYRGLAATTDCCLDWTADDEVSDRLVHQR